MQYDPLIEILNVAENSVEHPGKSAAIRNLQISSGVEAAFFASESQVLTEFLAF